MGWDGMGWRDGWNGIGIREDRKRESKIIDLIFYLPLFLSLSFPKTKKQQQKNQKTPKKTPHVGYKYAGTNSRSCTVTYMIFSFFFFF